MQYIKKLPLLLSMFMSIIISSISYVQGVEQKEVYIRMIISMVLFFSLGLFIRNSIEKIYESVSKKKNTDGSQIADNKGK